MKGQTTRSRFARSFRRGALVAALLAAVAALLYFVTLPRLARARIDALLRDLGEHHAQYTLRHVTLAGFEITDIRLGNDPWFAARNVHVHFDPLDLLAGRIDNIDVFDAAYRVAVRNGEVDWGFILPQQSRDAGRSFDFGAITLKDCLITIDHDGRVIESRIDGTLAAADAKRLRGDLTATAFDQPLHITVSLDALQKRLQARVDEFDFVPTSTLASAFPAFEGIVLAGRYALDADISFAGEAIAPVITLRAADAAIAHPDWPIAIVTASGTFAFDSVAPLSTQGPQRIEIAQATTGELDISQGEILFDLESLESLRIDSAAWAFSPDAGRFTTRDFSLNPQQPRIVANIAAENIDLNFWLKLLTNERADGEGRLRGEFAVDWNPRAYPRLQFTSGLLVAEPPTGFVRTHDAQRLGAMLDESNPELAIDETLRVVKQRIIDALEDFGYTSLRLEFIPDGRDTTLRAELQGKGRRGPNPQEFSGLVVNFRHFADALQNVLNARSAISAMREQAGERLKE